MFDSAAANLSGRHLKGGYEVVKIIEKEVYSTGSFFSVCYLAKKDNEKYFLKAFDFSKFFQISSPNQSVTDIMSSMLEAYNYEKNLSDFCKDKHVTKILHVQYAAEENIEGFTYPLVPFLIFQLADGDVRKNLHFSNNIDISWRLKTLRDISVGLKQLHLIEISHQDIKPSNILMIGEETKIGDLGRAICMKIKCPYSELWYSGDLNYAPPEILYNYYLTDWKKRVFATDCYALGSLIVFFFTGINMSAMIAKNMESEFHWAAWKGSYEEVKPYLINAFSRAVDEFQNKFADTKLGISLKWMVQKLCYPVPEMRGHPRTISYERNQYNMERFITQLDLLYRK